MTNLKRLQAALLSVSLTMSATSSAAIIDFDGITTSEYVVGSLVENGFMYSPFSGGLYGKSDFGNPGGNMQGRNAQGGGVLTISRIGGELFTFDAADVAQFNNDTDASIDFEGFFDGCWVGLDSFLASTSVGVWTSHNSILLEGILLDELRVTLDAAPDYSYQWWEGVDNLVLTTHAVPVPTAFWLLGSGLAGLVGIRRKKKA